MVRGGSVSRLRLLSNRPWWMRESSQARNLALGNGLEIKPEFGRVLRATLQLRGVRRVWCHNSMQNLGLVLTHATRTIIVTAPPRKHTLPGLLTLPSLIKHFYH